MMRRLLRVLASAVLAAVAWLLATNTPGLPPTGQLATASGADRLLEAIAWLGGLLLATGLAYRLARRPRANETAAAIHNLRPADRNQPRRRPLAAAYANRAFPLTVTSPLKQQERLAAAAETANPEPGNGPVGGSAGPSRTVSISLLGPISISGARVRGRRMRGATRELLVYLALHPLGANRDQITDQLWPEQPLEQARKRLWRAAADARTQLGEQTLIRDGEHYQLNRDHVAVDLDRLEHLTRELATTPQTRLPLLQEALALFRGEPLVGNDLPWAENDQRRLHALRLDLLEQTAHILLAENEPAAALAHAEQGLTSDPYNEKLTRLAMQAEATLGLRTAVIDRYQHLRHTLNERLGLEPQTETRWLYRHLLGQDEPRPPSSGVPTAASATDAQT